MKAPAPKQTSRKLIATVEVYTEAADALPSQGLESPLTDAEIRAFRAFIAPKLATDSRVQPLEEGRPAGLTRYLRLPRVKPGSKPSRREAEVLEFVEERSAQNLLTSHLEIQAAINWNSEATSLLKKAAAKVGAELYADMSKPAYLWYIRRGAALAS